MTQFKMLTEALRDGNPLGDRWYVTNGAQAVGPVGLELIERGLESGKVPLSSFLRHEAWKVWRPLADFTLIDRAPSSEPVTERRPTVTDDVAAPSRPTRLDEMDPDDAFAGSRDASDALLLLLSAAVRAVQADGALVYRAEDAGAKVVCAHGPCMFQMLGARVKLLDPAVVAAAAGLFVVAEPTPGPAGAAIRKRLEQTGVSAEGAIMLPVRPAGRLLAALELGRAAAFTPAEVARLGSLVSTLESKIASSGWSLARV